MMLEYFIEAFIAEKRGVKFFQVQTKTKTKKVAMFPDCRIMNLAIFSDCWPKQITISPDWGNVLKGQFSKKIHLATENLL